MNLDDCIKPDGLYIGTVVCWLTKIKAVNNINL